MGYVILGHSERREMFAETDETVNQKTIAAFKHGLTPIVCCGETNEEYEQDQTKTVVANQVTKSTSWFNRRASKTNCYRL